MIKLLKFYSSADDVVKTENGLVILERQVIRMSVCRYVQQVANNVCFLVHCMHILQ